MPRIIIEGPVGKLDARFHRAEREDAPIALVLHPNPQFGGDMNTPTVYNLFTAFADHGFSVLRFNYRGVGRSEGEFVGEAREVDDAIAALDWLKTEFPEASAVWFGGYSYGAFIGLHLLARRPEFARFIAIAPPAQKYDFSFLETCPAPGLFVHGTDDTLIPEPEVAKLVERWRASGGAAIDYALVEGASHFFDRHQAELDSVLNDYLDRTA